MESIFAKIDLKKKQLKAIMECQMKRRINVVQNKNGNRLQFFVVFAISNRSGHFIIFSEAEVVVDVYMLPMKKTFLLTYFFSSLNMLMAHSRSIQGRFRKLFYNFQSHCQICSHYMSIQKDPLLMVEQEAEAVVEEVLQYMPSKKIVSPSIYF